MISLNKYLFAAAYSMIGMAFAGSLQTEPLQRDLELLTRDFKGRVGVCARDALGVACVRADERFALQSVMKLIVGLAVMDAETYYRAGLPDHGRRPSAARHRRQR